MPRGVEVIGFVMIVVLIGLAVPVLVNAYNTSEKYYVEISENETERVAGLVNVTVTNQEIAGDNSTVKVVDHETLETEEKIIQDGENATFSFSTGKVTVGVEETASTGTRLYVELLPSFAWESSARAVGGVVSLVVVAMAVVVVLVFAAEAGGGIP